MVLWFLSRDSIAPSWYRSSWTIRSSYHVTVHPDPCRIQDPNKTISRDRCKTEFEEILDFYCRRYLITSLDGLEAFSCILSGQADKICWLCRRVWVVSLWAWLFIWFDSYFIIFPSGNIEHWFCVRERMLALQHILKFVKMKKKLEKQNYEWPLQKILRALHHNFLLFMNILLAVKLFFKSVCFLINIPF